MMLQELQVVPLNIDVGSVKRANTPVVEMSDAAVTHVTHVAVHLCAFAKWWRTFCVYNKIAHEIGMVLFNNGSTTGKRAHVFDCSRFFSTVLPELPHRRFRQ